MRRASAPQPARKPDSVLYVDFMAALLRLRDHGETVTIHDVTISWPKQQRSPDALRIESRRTVRCPWTGELTWAHGVSGGSIRNIKRVATMLAFEIGADRELRARLLSAARPGILANSRTHEKDVA